MKKTIYLYLALLLFPQAAFAANYTAVAQMYNSANDASGITASGNPETAIVGATTALTVSAISSGCSTGDVLIAFVGMAENVDTISSDDSEFTLYKTSYGTTGNDRQLEVWWREVTASEPADYGWTSTAAENWGVILECFSGVDTTTPIESDAFNVQADIGTTVDTNSVTSTVANSVVLTGGVISSSSAATTLWTAPTGTPTVTKIAQVYGSTSANYCSLSVGYYIQPTASATGTRTWTVNSVSTDEAIGAQLVLLPE